MLLRDTVSPVRMLRTHSQIRSELLSESINILLVHHTSWSVGETWWVRKGSSYLVALVAGGEIVLSINRNNTKIQNTHSNQLMTWLPSDICIQKLPTTGLWPPTAVCVQCLRCEKSKCIKWVIYFSFFKWANRASPDTRRHTHTAVSVTAFREECSNGKKKKQVACKKKTCKQKK